MRVKPIAWVQKNRVPNKGLSHNFISKLKDPFGYQSWVPLVFVCLQLLKKLWQTQQISHTSGCQVLVRRCRLCRVSWVVLRLVVPYLCGWSEMVIVRWPVLTAGAGLVRICIGGWYIWYCWSGECTVTAGWCNGGCWNCGGASKMTGGCITVDCIGCSGGRDGSWQEYNKATQCSKYYEMGYIWNSRLHNFDRRGWRFTEKRGELGTLWKTDYELESWVALQQRRKERASWVSFSKGATILTSGLHILWRWQE